MLSHSLAVDEASGHWIVGALETALGCRVAGHACLDNRLVNDLLACNIRCCGCMTSRQEGGLVEHRFNVLYPRWNDANFLTPIQEACVLAVVRTQCGREPLTPY